VNPAGPNVVDQFVDELNKSPLFEVDKTRMTRETPSDTEWAYGYSFPLVLGKTPESEKAAGTKKK